MLIEHRGMRAVVGVALVLVIAACTRPNPLDCADGLCSDPAFPFCDIDGSLEGETKTCIAVECSAGEFRACRGDIALVCNAVGNDYDLVGCVKGCDADVGCRACVANNECANPMPVCDDATSACRACKLDDECESMVCEDGSCIAESGILYASSTGSSASACSRADPCTIGRVQLLALDSAVPPLIRILPGAYIVGISVDGPTGGPMRFVATGATIAADKAVIAENGADVTIRGITAVGGTNAAVCSSTAARTKLAIVDSVLVPGHGVAVPLLVQSGCDVTASGTEVKPSDAENAIAIVSNASMSGERLLIRGTNIGTIGALGTGFSIGLRNSVLDNVDLVWVTLGASPPSYVALSFNTTVLASGSSIDCSEAAGLTRSYTHNVITAKGVTNAVQGTECTTLSHNVLFPQQAVPAMNIVAEPGFVDAAARDYHLTPTSPAVDAASADFLSPSTDFDGITRPQGAAVDIGAYELLQ